MGNVWRRRAHQTILKYPHQCPPIRTETDYKKFVFVNCSTTTAESVHFKQAINHLSLPSTMPVDAYDADRVKRIADPATFRWCSGEELRSFLSPERDWHVADFGSGTGLYTTELAPVAETVFAVDIRQEMHDQARSAGMAPNVVPLLADFTALPFDDDALDGGISIRTFHHGFDQTLDEISRVIRPDGRLVIVDWSATGAGERKSRNDEDYFDIATVQTHLLEHGFRISHASERRETFVVIATRR